MFAFLLRHNLKKYVLMFLCFSAQYEISCVLLGLTANLDIFKVFPKEDGYFRCAQWKDNIAFIGYFVRKRWRCIRLWCFRLGLGSLLLYHFRKFQRPVFSFGDNMMLYSCILDISESSCSGKIRKTKQTHICANKYLYFFFFFLSMNCSTSQKGNIFIGILFGNISSFTNIRTLNNSWLKRSRKGSQKNIPWFNCW